MTLTRRFVIFAGAWLLALPVAAAQGGKTAAPPTFNKEVAPILFANCVACHRPGEVAPMSLLTYQDARPWAKGIKAKVLAHEMPPWFADPRYGSFQNKRGLTQAQIDTLVAWADAGAPQGTGTAPVAPQIADTAAGTLAGFMTRPPDAVIDDPAEIDIPATGVLPFLNLWQKAPFTEDKYIEAVELRPSNRAVTHHSNVDIESSLPIGAHHIGLGPAWVGGQVVNAIPVREDGSPLACSVLANRSTSSAAVGGNDPECVRAAAEEAAANTEETFNFGNRLLFYAPGTQTLRFSPGLVKVIKRDDYMMWDIHYNATGRPEKDRHQVRLWFSKDTPTHVVRSGTANEVNLYEGLELVGQGVQRPSIPAFAENYRVSSLRAIKYDTTLNSVWPHMHLRGKNMTYSVTYPDGREEVLLSVPKYTFEWQIAYVFNQPIKLPAGSMLRVTAHFDNSANNKFNPAPDQELPWGSQSWHEMYFPYFDLTIDKDVLPASKGTN